MRSLQPVVQDSETSTRRIAMALVLIFLGVFFLLSQIFAIMEGSVRVESELQSLMSQPNKGTDLPTESEPVEVIIDLDAKGEVLVNEEKVVESLVEALIRIKSHTEMAKVMVTVSCHEQTPYHRMLEVMDALEKAKMDNVTLAVGAESF
jgi:biopolymer transport protein ExbD